MPPKRPRQHINADRSVARLHQIFTQVGWTVEDLDKDYGEDLLVRIFENYEATPFTFFVQAKSTDSLSRYLTKDKSYIGFPLDGSHLDYWLDFWEPVIVTLWDSSNDVTYWEVVQDPERNLGGSTSRPRLYIPVENRLDPDGLVQIRTRTKNRHRRLEIEQDGAEALVSRLEELLGVEIEYDPQHGVLIVTTPDGKPHFTFLGKLAENIRIHAEKNGRTTDEEVNTVLAQGLEESKRATDKQAHLNKLKRSYLNREW